MRNKTRLLLIAPVIGLLFLFAAGILFKTFYSRGIPFVSKKEQWTIGIYRGNSPFSFNSPLNLLNPVFRAEDVTDVNAKFVADPFLIKDASTWFLFFEVYNNATKQGDLALATSKNTFTWNYEKVILDEPFHLSYPYVFKWEDDYYLIPESYEANSIRLYRAENFPTKWTYIKTLVEGRDFVDNSIAYFNGKFWLFSSVTSNDTLYLFFADELLGPWQEHPQSPIVTGNNHIARPGGRMLVYEDKLYRYAQDINLPTELKQIFAYEITEITPTRYAERPVSEDPILKASGSGWKRQGIHQVDPVLTGKHSWVASVDGFGEYLVFGRDK